MAKIVKVHGREVLDSRGNPTKSNSLPTWALILFIIEVAAILGFVAYFVIRRVVKKRTRIKRLQNQQQ